MIQPDDDNKGYVRTKTTRPRGWLTVRDAGDPHALRCRHTNRWIVEKPSGDGAELTRLLNDFRNSGIGDRAQRARPGREKQFFDTEMVVSRLPRAIASTNEPRPIIEAYLDSLFEDFQPGTLFEHCTIVMAILHALQRGNTQAFIEISDAFIKSPAAEIAPIRRFAIDLRNE